MISRPDVTFFNIEPPGPDSWPFQRQTGDGLGGHGAVQFHFDGRPDADWLVAFSDVPHDVETRVPHARRILVVTEPPGIRTYTKMYADQFGVLISPIEIAGYRGRWVRGQGGLPWWYGITKGQGKVVCHHTLASLAAMPVPKKAANRISIITSNKTKIARHRDRVRLVDFLQRTFPSAIDVFGYGYQPVGDKAEAIDGYRYQIVIENNEIADFWTEKLSDALLGYALPLYSGCPNITDYFPGESIIQLGDITAHKEVARTIEQVLSTDPWSGRFDALVTARQRLLHEHNLFSVITGIASGPAALVPLIQAEWLYRFDHQFKGPAGAVRGWINRAQVLAARR
jgi:hypothetical protein